MPTYLGGMTEVRPWPDTSRRPPPECPSVEILESMYTSTLVSGGFWPRKLSLICYTYLLSMYVGQDAYPDL